MRIDTTLAWVGLGMTIASTALSTAFPHIPRFYGFIGLVLGIVVALIGVAGLLRPRSSSPSMSEAMSSDQAFAREMLALADRLRKAARSQAEWQSDSDVVEPFMVRIDRIDAGLKARGIVIASRAYRCSALQWAENLETIAHPLERNGLSAAKEVARALLERNHSFLLIPGILMLSAPALMFMIVGA